MAAYVIVDTRIKDPAPYEEYKKLARPIVEKFGGTYVARGGRTDVVQDQLWSPTRIVIVRFDSMDAAHAFLDSEEYAPVKAIRHAHADCTTLVIEGEEAG